MEVKREFWVKKVQEAWEKAPIVWMAGVRRTGKTTLCKAFGDADYLNCDLPSVQDKLSDPESFLKKINKRILILDEIHQLPEATNLLKIAADEYKKMKILAAGSSTLVASKKFKDSLTGRKRNIHFLPVLVSELENFQADLEKRILHGGLPPALLFENLDREFYAEWVDSFYARDIQELFKVEKRQPFLKALDWLLASNGNALDASKLAQVSGISRPTAVKYLDILEVTKAISLVRPFSKNPLQEIVSQPKVYGFDTGFSCHAKGIHELRSEDCGLYLENLVLETLLALGGDGPLYWRNKNGNEVDFVLPQSRDDVTAIECKWREKNFDDKNLQIFRRSYPKGRNIVVTSDSKTRTQKHKDLSVRFVNILDLQRTLGAEAS